MFPRALANRWVDGVEAELVQDLPLDPRAMIGGNQPPKAKRTFKRRCPETGVEFETTGKDRMFATDQDKANFHNRSSKVGRTLVPVAMAWRQGRNAKGNSPLARARRASAARAFGEMCRLLDAAIADDNAEGRMPKLDYVRQRAAVSGSIVDVERVKYQTRLVDAEAAIRVRLGAAAEAMTARDLRDLAVADLRRADRAEKESLLAAIRAKRAEGAA